MHITILTLFPEMFRGPFNFSIIKRAQEKKLLTIDFVNLRDFGLGKYKSVDDHPYGGGVGMILRADVIDRALANLKIPKSKSKTKIVLLSPTGKTFTQEKAKKISRLDSLILICGHYEGVDARVSLLVDEEISIGDYVLTGGEIPAMVVVDAVVRLIPGVLAKEEATRLESFSRGLLEHPQYTKPANYRGMKVPQVLLSGHHENILKWRKTQSLKNTVRKRPGLLKK